MPRLTYWIAICKDDSQVYNIRERTRKAVVARLEQHDNAAKRFSEPVKVSIEYANAFDLAENCLGEGGGYWEVE